MLTYKFGNILKKETLVSNNPAVNTRKINATLNELLHNIVLKRILVSDYKYETVAFGMSKENKTSKKFLKIVFKTIQYRHDLVYNDILAKTFNGIKTFLTINTQMHKIFNKVKRAKPLSIFKLKFKRIQTVSPTLKEFYNLTGHTVGYNVYQFFDNKKYNYTHNLKNFSISRKALYFTMLKEITTGKINVSDALMISQTYKKAKLRIRVFGFRFKIYNPKMRPKFRYHKLKDYYKITRDSTLRKKRKYFKVLFANFKKHLII